MCLQLSSRRRRSIAKCAAYGDAAAWRRESGLNLECYKFLRKQVAHRTSPTRASADLVTFARPYML